MKTNSNKLRRAILQLDLFGEKVGFNIEGESSRKSIIGTLVSCYIFCVIVPYAYSKFEKMRNYGDTKHQTIRSSESLTSEDKETIQNFNVMMYLQTNVIQTLRIGDYLDAKLYYAQADLNFGGEFSYNETELEFSPCKADDIEGFFNNTAFFQ